MCGSEIYRFSSFAGVFFTVKTLHLPLFIGTGRELKSRIDPFYHQHLRYELETTDTVIQTPRLNSYFKLHLISLGAQCCIVFSRFHMYDIILRG